MKKYLITLFCATSVWGGPPLINNGGGGGSSGGSATNVTVALTGDVTGSGPSTSPVTTTVSHVSLTALPGAVVTNNVGILLFTNNSYVYRGQTFSYPLSSSSCLAEIQTNFAGIAANGPQGIPEIWLAQVGRYPITKPVYLTNSITIHGQGDTATIFEDLTSTTTYTMANVTNYLAREHAAADGYLWHTNAWRVGIFNIMPCLFTNYQSGIIQTPQVMITDTGFQMATDKPAVLFTAMTTHIFLYRDAWIGPDVLTTNSQFMFNPVTSVGDMYGIACVILNYGQLTMQDCFMEEFADGFISTGNTYASLERNNLYNIGVSQNSGGPTGNGSLYPLTSWLTAGFAEYFSPNVFEACINENAAYDNNCDIWLDGTGNNVTIHNSTGQSGSYGNDYFLLLSTNSTPPINNSSSYSSITFQTVVNGNYTFSQTPIPGVTYNAAFYGFNGGSLTNIQPHSVTNAPGFWNASPSGSSSALPGYVVTNNGSATLYGEPNVEGFTNTLSVIPDINTAFSIYAGLLGTPEKPAFSVDPTGNVYINGAVTLNSTITGNGGGLTNLVNATNNLSVALLTDLFTFSNNVYASGTNAPSSQSAKNATNGLPAGIWSLGNAADANTNTMNVLYATNSGNAATLQGASTNTVVVQATNAMSAQLGSAAYTASSAYDASGAALKATNILSNGAYTTVGSMSLMASNQLEVTNLLSGYIQIYAYAGTTNIGFQFNNEGNYLYIMTNCAVITNFYAVNAVRATLCISNATANATNFYIIAAGRELPPAGTGLTTNAISVPAGGIVQLWVDCPPNMTNYIDVP